MGTFSSVSLYGWGLMSPAYIVSLLLRGQRFVGATAQVGWILADGNGVRVYNAIKAFVCLAKRRKIADGAKVVANRQIAARLYAGEADFLFTNHF